MFKNSYAVLDRKRAALLKKISEVGPFITASACYLKVRCGNPKCKCAENKEDRHQKLHLSWSTKERHTSQYVPVDLHEEVHEWIENYWTIKGYMKEMSEISRQMIKIYSKTKGKVLRGKEKLSKARKKS